MVDTEEDDLQFLEDVLSEVEIDKVMKDMETMEQKELCRLLVVEGGTSVAFYLYRENGLPAYLMAKVSEHLQECYRCNETYRDYCCLDDDLRAVNRNKRPNVTLSKEEIGQRKDILFQELFGPDWRDKVKE